MTAQTELKSEVTKIIKEKKHIISKTVCLVFLFIGFLLFFASLWYINTYGDTGFDSILFTLFSNLEGTQPEIVWGFMLSAFLPAVILTVLSGIFLFYTPKKKRRFYPVKHIYRMSIAIVLIVASVVTAGINAGAIECIRDLRQQSVIFTERYVDPDTVNITFPEKKRNLIYIFLESMETTFFSHEEGGARDVNLIPELYELAENNVSFSNNDGIGGFRSINGATWTVAAMTAQTAGIPLKAPGMFKRNAYGRGTFLPGAKSITNVLKDNGYYQALMFGSDDVFANRDVYYKDHGIDIIYDLDSARADGLIPEDYYVWWGMEDFYLFDYAKTKLTEIAQREEPFSFTMLTVDTHQVDGYKCKLCGDEHAEQYDNVYSCSSVQVAEFVEWLKQQSFYENTTVVICGDHPTMDKEYIKRTAGEDYTRHIYNCILNSQAETDNYKNREFSSVDWFPTTLAAIGCEIEGERLGLGTNLFSDTPTLIEEMGYDAFNDQIKLNSNFYTMKFVLNQK